jgi:nucleoside-diphosphate-sugar epimerase
MKKILVTGGAGFIGSNLTERLMNMGLDVTVVDDLSSGHNEFFMGKENFTMDFADPIILDKVSNSEFDVIFHQAAMPRVSLSVEQPYETTETNIAKTIKLMEAARGNVNRFVFASSSSVYGGAKNMPTKETEPLNPVSPYALQKKTIEDFAKMFHRLYGLDIVCLRYFNVFGPYQYGDSPYSTAVAAWCHAIKHGTPLRSDGDGEQSRDLCYVDNVVDANIIVATADTIFKGDCFNVACGDRTSNNEILEFLKKRFGDLNIEHAPERPGDVKHTQADISALSKYGYEPKVRFWDGLEKTIQWWKI